MDVRFYVVISSVILLSFVRSVTGLSVCEDREPCQEYLTNNHCENPGIPALCMKTCKICTDENGFNCTKGYVENRTSCTACAELTLEDIFNRTHSCPQDCPRGWWGRVCSKTCDSCSQGSCEKWSGRCLGNCPSGRYGRSCELHCENCLHGSCCVTGICQSCKPGWRGPRCLQR